jgi:hypothetical protein
VRGALQGAPGPAREGAGDGWLKRVPLEAAPQGRPEEGAHTYAIRPVFLLCLCSPRLATPHSALDRAQLRLWQRGWRQWR